MFKMPKIRLFAVAAYLVFLTSVVTAKTVTNGLELTKTYFFTNSSPLFPAECQVSGCATGQVLAYIPAINCPAKKGTCTYEIEVCSQVTINTASIDDDIFFRFLVDGFGSPVNPGPVTGFGEYAIEQPSTVPAGTLISRCASVIDSDNPPGDHSVDVAVAVRDSNGNGASITGGLSKVTIRVYQVRLNKRH